MKTEPASMLIRKIDDMRKEILCHSTNERRRSSPGGAIPFLLSQRYDWVAEDMASEKCCEQVMALAESDPDAFFQCVERIGIWAIQLHHVLLPLIRRFLRPPNYPALSKIISKTPESLVANSLKWKKSSIAPTLLVGIHEGLGSDGEQMDDGACQEVGDLVTSFLASRWDGEFLRITVGCYLLAILHGDIEETEADTQDVKAAKRMFKWMALPRSEWSGDAVSLFKEAWGADLPEAEGKEWGHFKECGILPESQHPYSFMFMAAKLLDLPFTEEQLDGLLRSCFASHPSSLYWADKTPFSPLGVNIADSILQKEAPVAFMRDVRTCIDAMWYRMRANHENKSVIHHQKIAELYLMVMVCLVEQMCRGRKFAEAKALFDLAWDDCVTGLYIGQGIWDAPANYIQYLFYYKVAFLSAFSGKWNNSDLLEQLPLRGRDTDSMTYREMCLGWLLRNGGGIPWDDVSQSDPKLNAEIEAFREKSTEKSGAGPAGP